MEKSYLSRICIFYIDTLSTFMELEFFYWTYQMRVK